LPTPVPAPVPTPAPLNTSPVYSCSLATAATDYSLISEGNAVIDAQNFNAKGLLIGGNLSRSTSSWGNINVKSFVQGSRTGNWNWNTNTVGPFSALVDFEHFRYLSRNAISSTASNGSKVVVINNGGTFSSPSASSPGFDQNTQNVLIIFNTDADVTLNFGMNNLNFSILAPRSKTHRHG
jgi:hypothetical protein